MGFAVIASPEGAWRSRANARRLGILDRRVAPLLAMTVDRWEVHEPRPGPSKNVRAERSRHFTGAR
jgi:hypothetical protein